MLRSSALGDWWFLTARLEYLRLGVRQADQPQGLRSAIMLFLNQEATEDKRVHAGTKEGAERVGGCVHDGLAT